LNTTTERWQNLSNGLIKARLLPLNFLLIYAKMY
jgi:hypothetical protein